MLSDMEKELILTCAHKYGVTELYLFGSTLKSDQYHDIDLGVKGVSPMLFFKFYGELLRKLLRPVDVIDLSKRSQFVDMIEKEGVKLYG
ncbi:MAG: nucleotidyltransferase domain-containing protein [Anaerolineae bacterium]